MIPDPMANNASTSGAILHVRNLRLLRHLIISMFLMLVVTLTGPLVVYLG
jgi:hypothetical protein